MIFRMQLTLSGPDFSVKGGCAFQLMCTHLLQLNVNVILEHKLALKLGRRYLLHFLDRGIETKSVNHRKLILLYGVKLID